MINSAEGVEVVVERHHRRVGVELDGSLFVEFLCEFMVGRIGSPIPLFGVQSLPGFPIVW
jgi:hypothetical protein